MQPLGQVVIAGLGLVLVATGLLLFVRRRPGQQGATLHPHSVEWKSFKVNVQAPTSIVLIIIGVVTTGFPFVWTKDPSPQTVTVAPIPESPPSVAPVRLERDKTEAAILPVSTLPALPSPTPAPAPANFAGSWRYAPSAQTSVNCFGAVMSLPVTGGISIAEEGERLIYTDEDATSRCTLLLQVRGKQASLLPGQTCANLQAALMPTMLKLTSAGARKLRIESAGTVVASGVVCNYEMRSTLMRVD